MKNANHIWALFIIALSGIVFASLPYLPIDETRYLTVAWEMKLNNSFLVPILNGVPYSHKPPFLFWLINLDWFVFGMNEKTLRLIPLVFSLLNIGLLYKVALTLWDDKKMAGSAALILSSTLLYLIWSPLIMFDVILTFWVLMGIYGLLSAAKKDNMTSWMLLGISIGGGLLTKGPVLFVHLLPVSLLYPFWKPNDEIKTKVWYSKLLLSLFAGLSIALLWAIPAAIKGGETYGTAILIGQTSSRLISSVAHQRSIWWYIPIIPALFFPWIFIKPAWTDYATLKCDRHLRFLGIWIFSTFVIFSLISGKQVYYLLPMLPAGSLLIAKNIHSKTKMSPKWHYPVAIFYAVLGGALLLLPLIKNLDAVGGVSLGLILMLAIGLILMAGIMLFMKSTSTDKLIRIIACSSIGFILIVFSSANELKERYDLHKMSEIIKAKQDEGYVVMNFKTYYGQYQFLGRLTEPIVAFKHREDAREFIKTHDKVLLISYEKPEEILDENDVVYQQPYRGEKVVLWKGDSILRHYR